MTTKQKLIVGFIVQIIHDLFILGYVLAGLSLLDYDITARRVLGVMALVFAVQVGLKRTDPPAPA